MATRRRALLTLLPLCLAFALDQSSAICLDTGGFPIFQCANYAHFPPPPVPVSFDPGHRPRNVTEVFWQIGFGNRTLELAASSTSGTGVTGATSFNGNDSGGATVDVKDTRVALGNFISILPGSLCLSVTNWGNYRVDGCADSDRQAAVPYSDDGALNPYMDLYQLHTGVPGVYTLDQQADYPMALLLKAPADIIPCDTTAICGGNGKCLTGALVGSPCGSEYQCGFCPAGPRANQWCAQDNQCADDRGARYFAIAAVASMDRQSTGNGQNGPCHPTDAGANPAPCDYRPGYYDFTDVTNGALNPLSGRFNVIPWQEPPAPALACVAGCAGTGAKTLDITWPAVTIYHDSSIRPTTNPSMGPADPTRASGVGVLDVAAKFPLVRYQLESAPVTCVNFDSNGVLLPQTLAWSSFGAETPATSLGGVTVPADTCLRTRVLFGKRPETTGISVANCRKGKCGDIGYDAARNDLDAIRCVGGFLDADGDGALTCGGQDCDDANPGASATPGLVNVESVDELPSGAVRYSWTNQAPAAGSGTHYDVYSGSAYSLAGVGDFTHGSCFADNLTTPYIDVDLPGMQPNEYLYFLVRAQNGCATPTSGFGTGGRDAGAASSAAPCD